jgi:PHD/YefM family antitoxin component YafN of YafNO toxin-antitoxin module
MRSISAGRARAHFDLLLEELAATGEAIHIRGRHTDAVLVTAHEWRSMQETLYLTSIPGMRESILAGLNAPASDFSPDVPWTPKH